MLFEKQNVKADCFIASRAETKCGLKTSRIPAREQGSKMIQPSFQLTRVLNAQSVDAGKAQNITLHMKMLNFALKVLTSFSKNLAQGQNDALSIVSIRSATMSQGT
jgi:hypothetical protein